jgi:hypothetical protein
MNQTQPDLRLGTECKTFGVTIDSTVLEFVKHEPLAWDAHCNGVHAYRAWGFPANNALPKIFPKPSGLRINCHPLSHLRVAVH